jgi:hypothetical protein
MFGPDDTARLPEVDVNESGFLAERRVAVLVDGDNLPPSMAAPILAAAGRFGRADLRRVYAAEVGSRGWAGAAGYRTIQAGGAKNGTDLLLCIEAVEAACRGSFGTFVIASDDRDFTHLAHWLRERGLNVLGLGTAKSPNGWRAACSQFELLRGESEPRALKPQGLLADLDRKLRASIGAQRVSTMMQLGSRMSQAGARPPNGTTWRAYMQTRPDLYQLDAKGPAAQVRWIGSEA